jgi:multiple sugar transport system substrate-binding protein
MKGKPKYFMFFMMMIGSCRNHQSEKEGIVFWCANNPREIALCDSITNEWNRDRPGDLIHLQPVPEGQSSEEVILAAVVGKTTPDIYANMWQGNVEMYGRAGVLIPLDTLQGFLSFIKERCDSSVIKEITSGDGHIYQIPWKVNPFMSIYNVDLLKKKGIDYLPATYSEYLQAAAKFKNKVDPTSQKKNWFGFTEIKEIWYQRLFNFYPLYLAASNGAPLVVNNKAVFNNQYAVQVFTFLQTLYRDGYFSTENLAAFDDPFGGQQIATTWTGPWEIAYLNTRPDQHFLYEYAQPQVPDDHQGPVYTYADPKNIVIFNSCKDPDKAWRFLRTMIDQQGDLMLLKITGQLPRRKNLLTNNFYTSYFSQNPLMVPFAKQLPFIRGVDNCEMIVEVLDIISQEYAACVIYGKKTPERAITDAEKAVNVLLGTRNN